jgi:Ca2+-binding RTX toxin-like protein
MGTTGNDTLDGGLGKDTLVGSDGDDLYVVDNTGDKIIENLDEGIDSVQSKISYVLGNNLENLELLSSSNINATGNALNNKLSGNDGNNILKGMAGDDTLICGKGNDKLIGGTGADTFEFNIDDFFSKDETGNFIFKKSMDTVDFNLQDNDTLVFNLSGDSMFSSDYLAFYPDLASAKLDESELFYVKGTIYLNIDTTATHYTPVAIIKLTRNPKVNNAFTDFAYPDSL